MSRRYEIGQFVLDADARVLTRAGIPTPLGSRAIAVLQVLVDRANEHVPKADILDAAWPGVVVEESNLAVQISAIRRVLTEQKGGDRWIETLARRGYRFVGPVKRLDHEGSQDVHESRGHHLPHPASAFVGRGRELAELRSLLPQTRLLTLTGTGGIGKTRLALRAADDAADAYPDGVVLIELAAISDPGLVPATLAQALGLEDRPGRQLVDLLRADLRARRMLLVFDNCEHLLEGCARLIDALLRQAGPTIIATSREPLRLSGEQLFPLSPLTLPDPAAGLDQIATAESVQLFVDRARRMQPEFQLTPERAPAVAELCVHLDGIPLALELAAARVRSLSVEQIAARLGDRFRLLTTGTRDGAPRQQTLRAMFDWSHDLLSEPERVVFRRLAVFAGSFALEAACNVASDEALDEHSVVDVLSQLVTRSLVVANATDSEVRYHLLETTRAYALDKLIEAGEVDRRRSRHAEYFRTVGERASVEWMLDSDQEWRDRFLPEAENIRAALDWALGEGHDAGLAVALAGSSAPIWTTLSRWHEALRWIEAAAATIDAQTSPSDEARLWLWSGNAAQGEPQRAIVALERAIALYRQLGDSVRLGQALTYYARPAARMHLHDESLAALAEAQSLLEPAAPPKLLGFFFSNRSFAKKMIGDPMGSPEDDERALTFLREAGADWAVLAHVGIIADSRWAIGDLDGALAKFLEQAATLRKSRFTRRTTLGYSLANLAGLHTERGELDEALTAAREALPLLGNGGPAWLFADHLALRLALAGRTADAARLEGFAEAAFASRKSNREPNEARAQQRVGALLRERIAGDELERLLGEGGAMSEEQAWRIALEQ